MVVIHPSPVRAAPPQPACLVVAATLTFQGLSGVAGGLGLVTWIAVQVRMIGYRSDPPPQAVYGALGLLIFALGLAPSVRRYARR